MATELKADDVLTSFWCPDCERPVAPKQEDEPELPHGEGCRFYGREDVARKEIDSFSFQVWKKNLAYDATVRIPRIAEYERVYGVSRDTAAILCFVEVGTLNSLGHLRGQSNALHGILDTLKVICMGQMGQSAAEALKAAVEKDQREKG